MSEENQQPPNYGNPFDRIRELENRLTQTRLDLESTRKAKILQDNRLCNIRDAAQRRLKEEFNITPVYQDTEWLLEQLQELENRRFNEAKAARSNSEESLQAALCERQKAQQDAEALRLRMKNIYTMVRDRLKTEFGEGVNLFQVTEGALNLLILRESQRHKDSQMQIKELNEQLASKEDYKAECLHERLNNLNNTITTRLCTEFTEGSPVYQSTELSLYRLILRESQRHNDSQMRIKDLQASLSAKGASSVKEVELNQLLDQIRGEVASRLWDDHSTTVPPRYTLRGAMELERRLWSEQRARLIAARDSHIKRADEAEQKAAEKYSAENDRLRISRDNHMARADRAERQTKIAKDDHARTFELLNKEQQHSQNLFRELEGYRFRERTEVDGAKARLRTIGHDRDFACPTMGVILGYERRVNDGVFKHQREKIRDLQEQLEGTRRLESNLRRDLANCRSSVAQKEEVVRNQQGQIQTLKDKLKAGPKPTMSKELKSRLNSIYTDFREMAEMCPLMYHYSSRGPQKGETVGACVHVEKQILKLNNALRENFTTPVEVSPQLERALLDMAQNLREMAANTNIPTTYTTSDPGSDVLRTITPSEYAEKIIRSAGEALYAAKRGKISPRAERALKEVCDQLLEASQLMSGWYRDPSIPRPFATEKMMISAKEHAQYQINALKKELGL